MDVEVFDGSEPAYKQLCEKIIKAITEGELKPGDRLPSEAALYHSTGLSKGTIRMAYEELEHKGCIKRSRGSGTYIQEWRSERQKMQAYREKVLRAGIPAEEAFQLIEEACRKKFSKKEEVQAALFDCTPEIAADISRKIEERFKFLPVCYDVYEVLEAFGGIVPEAELWLTTTAHYHELQNLAKAYNKTLIKLQISVDDKVVETLSGLSGSCIVGIIYESRDFIKHVSLLTSSLCKHNTYFICRKDEWKDRRSLLDSKPVCWIVPARYEEMKTEAEKEENMEVLFYRYKILPDSYTDLEAYLQEV